MKKYTALLFDMDGVIADSMQYHARAWMEVLAEEGLSLDRIDIFKREGMSGLDSIVDIFREKMVEPPGMERLKKLQEKKHAVFERNRVGVFPRVEDILSLASSRGLLLGLVTGSLRRSVNHVLPPEIGRYFDTIVSVEDIVHGKPHPESYLLALSRLGSRASEAMAVENAPQGIQSAKGAGLYCLALETTLPGSYLSAADEIFGDHEALLEYFERIL